MLTSTFHLSKAQCVLFSRAIPSLLSPHTALGHAFAITGRAIHPPQAHALSTSSRRLALAAEHVASTSPAPSSPSTTSQTATALSDPKIARIVDEISTLTLLQAADLVTLLKARLNIQEIAIPAAAVPAPTTAAPAEEATVEEKPKAKTIFNVTLESFDTGAKPKVIREVKALVPNLTLIDAKKFVESLPKVLKENLSKEDAEKLKATFEAIGAVVKLD